MNKCRGFSKMWFLVLLLVTFVAGCGSNDPAVPVDAKAFTSFSFVGFPAAPGTINETAKTIAVMLPSGTSVTNLIATFTTTGSDVKIGAVIQTSGVVPANNFANAVTYTVTAADGTFVDYVVTVTAAPITAKAITAFSFVGFPAAPGTVNETAKTIAVILPSGTSVTNLTANFTTTGSSVKIGAVVQTSGVVPANNFANAVTYTVTAADGTSVPYIVTVTVTAALSPAKAITAFSFVGFPAAPGTINETAKTIAVILPSGTSVTNLTANFTTTGSSVKIGAVVQTSGVVPANDFTSPVVYTVTAADGTTATYNVAVTVAIANPTAPNLGEAGRFVILAAQAVTTTTGSAISNGDIGVEDQARSFITGFTDGATAGQFTELTNGMSYAPNDANPAPFALPLHFSTPVVGAPWTTTAAMITQAKTDLGIADTFLAADPNPSAPTQVCPIQLGGLILNRGFYLTASDVQITTGPLHLDAQGDPNAVFIFTIGGKLTTGVSGSIILDNGAKAKNVYFRTAGITTIAAGTSFHGNVFATTQVNVLAGANVTGRLFAVTDRVTLISNIVTKAP